MKAILKKISRKDFALFICAGLMVSLIYSKFAISVAMILLICVAVFEFNEEKAFPFQISTQLKTNFRKCLYNKPMAIISIFFFLVLFSGIYSSDTVYLMERLRIKLPFLLLPFAFCFLPKFEQKEYKGLLVFLIGLLFLSTLKVGIEYFINFEEITTNIGKGQTVPTPMHHIRYSLMIAIGIIAGIYLLVEQFYIKYPWERYLILMATFFLFVFIHILSVRSGLLALYLAIVVLCIRYIVVSRKYLIGLGGILIISMLPVLAYHTLPSFHTKVHYSIWDIKQYLEGKGESYSDSARLVSLKMGYAIFKENPLIGVGSGDLKKAIFEKYHSTYGSTAQWKMPHNQILSVLAGTGILGMILFLLAFFYPLFYQKNYQQSIYLGFMVIVFISFLMENTFETSIGVGIFSFFNLFFIKWCMEHKN